MKSRMKHSISYPGTPPCSMWFAIMTSFDQTSKCHFLSPRTPHITEPLWMPILMLRSTYRHWDKVLNLNLTTKYITYFNYYVGIVTDVLDCLDHMQSCLNAAYCVIRSWFPALRIKHRNAIVAIAQKFDTQAMVILWDTKKYVEIVK